ncbi:MAG: amidohydrolase family protein [Deltaproteobacteria bacterium]|nr:amidohydrolase family protein [Deltaproteobacteria bacterium]MBI3077629.1 amidohydrolase family protein [Deltaproteobacteria bacterium]
MLGLSLLAGLLVRAGLAQELSIFDAHIHYSEPAWGPYPPEAVLRILDRAGVRRALVSSTPDDGTLRLHAQAPRRIVPVLRPYRSRDDMSGWTQDPAVLAYVESRLRLGVYRGIGEFHLSAGQAAAVVPRGLVALAARHRLFLHVHADDVAVEELIRLRPEVRVLWAHAGMSSPPETVGRLLDRYPTLQVELALRFDVASGGTLDPAWRALFLRYPERFLVGTDTWINAQWERLPEILDGFRVWLRQLPPEVAEQIAYRNAERLAAGP